MGWAWSPFCGEVESLALGGVGNFLRYILFLFIPLVNIVNKSGPLAEPCRTPIEMKNRSKSDVSNI